VIDGFRDPMEKVFRCPNVLARRNPLITALGQFLGESFKQMTTGATAQLLFIRPITPSEERNVMTAARAESADISDVDWRQRRA
jgi:hypothetical protein